MKSPRLRQFARWVQRHAPEPSTDRLVVAAVFVSVLVLTIALATLMFTIQGRSSDAQARKDARITACRASLSARLVTGPTAKALRALALEGTDSDAFQDAVGQADPDLFVELSILSDSDPELFLRRCTVVLRDG